MLFSNIYRHSDGPTSLGVWQLYGNADALAGHTADLIDEEVPPIANEENRKHYWGSRLALTHLLENEPVKLKKDTFGKLYMDDHSGVHVSLSHGHGYTAAIRSASNCGIDIELMNGRIDRIAGKFINDQEALWIQSATDRYLVWCAKEALYKIYGRKQVDFKKHLTIRLSENRKILTGTINMDNFHKTIQLFFHTIDDLLVVWGLDL